MSLLLILGEMDFLIILANSLACLSLPMLSTIHWFLSHTRILYIFHLKCREDALYDFILWKTFVNSMFHLLHKWTFIKLVWMWSNSTCLIIQKYINMHILCSQAYLNKIHTKACKRRNIKQTIKRTEHFPNTQPMCTYFLNSNSFGG